MDVTVSGGILELLVAIGLNALTLIDYGPYLLILAGLALNGLTILIAFKDRKRLFKASTLLTPSFPRLNSMEKQMQTKALSIYPKLFTVTDGLQAIPSLSHQPFTRSSNQVYVNRESQVKKVHNNKHGKPSSLPDIY